jgi:hypothetical protein
LLPNLGMKDRSYSLAIVLGLMILVAVIAG